MTEDEARRTLERYRSSVAYPVAGQPFGWGVVQFKARFQRRLMDRGWDEQRAWWRAQRAYERVMRYKPSFGDYCQAQAVLRPKPAPPIIFTDDELQHMIETWQDANDPTSRAIALKAAEILQRRS